MMRPIHKTACLLACLSLGGCPAMPPIPQLAAKLPGFTLVPVPSSLLQPGAVIQVTAADGGPIASSHNLSILWLGTLSNCSVPASALQVAQGAVPDIQSSDKLGINAEIAAKAAGLDFGSIGANVGRDAELSITSSSDVVLNYLQFAAWANDAGNRKLMADACGSKLTQRNVFVVQEAFVINSGSYTFQNSSGGKVAVAPPNSPIGASGSVTVDHSGSVTITAPTVFGIKGLQQLPSGAFDVAALTPPQVHWFGTHHASRRPPAAPHIAPIVPTPMDLGAVTITQVSGLPPA